MAIFPEQLTDYLQPSVDKFTFVVSEALDDSELGIDITSGVDAFVVPCIINIEDELIHIESKSSPTLTASASGRGYGGTTAAAHDSGVTGYIPLTAEHYDEMIVGAAAVRKYICRTVASLPATGLEEEYDIVEYADEIYMYTGSGWERIGITLSHDSWRNLSSGDPHPVYYTESRLETAHDNISGEHVTDGDSHDHLEGTGIGAIDTTMSRIASPPTYDGEVVLDTTSGVLYVSYIDSPPAAVADWIEVIGAPTGLVMAFDPSNLSGACPTGWSRYTALDEKFVRGTSSSSQTTGGSASHVHTFTKIIDHEHSISSQAMNTTSTKSHTHRVGTSTGGGADDSPLRWLSSGSGAHVSSSSSGGHTHTITMSNDTQSTGEAAPETSSVNGEPSYQKVVWCQKD